MSYDELKKRFMKEFEWNDFGVCTNPNKIEKRLDKYNYIIIKTACRNGEWYDGRDLAYATGGVGSPCSMRCKGFRTEHEAIMAAIGHATNDVQNWANFHVDKDHLISWHKKALNELIFEQRQMSLFDYD